jgi:hypothetical protein
MNGRLYKNLCRDCATMTHEHREIRGMMLPERVGESVAMLADDRWWLLVVRVGG